MSTVKRFYLNLILFLSLITNLVLGLAVGSNLVDSSEKFPYLSKRIFVDDPNDVLINFVPLRAALREYASKQAVRIGFYFEYLPSGISIGVNDQEEVRLVSLAKVPTIMAVYRQINLENLKPEQILKVSREDINKDSGDLWKRGEGVQITLEEAINLTLTESDNTAHNLLLRLIQPEDINAVYDSLDIQVRQEDGFPVVTPKSYSSILRSLYLSSYLSQQYSNEILELLTQTKFKDKLTAGVPSSIKVAHKVGVLEGKDASLSLFLDCGIIYVPNRPYLLCMFVNGSDEEAQVRMKSVSQTIYEYVVSANR